MPEIYRPPQRVVPATLLAGGRWIGATFHVAQLHGFDEVLAKDRPFLKLTDVDLGDAGTLPFLALRSTAAAIVIPDCSEERLMLALPGEVSPRRVQCFLERQRVRGRLDLRPGVRVSDYLQAQRAFILVRDATLDPPIPGRSEPHPVVFINAASVIGIAQEDVGVDAATPTPVPLAPTSERGR